MGGMKRGIALAGALWATEVASQEAALHFPPAGTPAAWDNLTLAVTQADGAVDVVLAVEPDPDRLSNVLSLLAIGTADQVRFSATYDVPGRREALAGIERFARANGLAWAVCPNWWLSPDVDYLAAEIREDLGGSLVFIDNGPSSDAPDNPDADLAAAMREDPAFAGVLGPDARRVEDAADYFDASTAVWMQVVPNRALDPARQDKGGWVDGC